MNSFKTLLCDTHRLGAANERRPFVLRKPLARPVVSKSFSFDSQGQTRFFGAQAVPGLRFVSLSYASKAASTTLPGTPWAPAKLLRTPEGPKGWDGKAAGRRLTDVSQARERRQHALWGPLGRVCSCQSKLAMRKKNFLCYNGNAVCQLQNQKHREDIQTGLNDSNSLSHTKWNCKYHIVFAPKYRRKVWTVSIMRLQTFLPLLPRIFKI